MSRTSSFRPCDGDADSITHTGARPSRFGLARLVEAALASRAREINVLIEREGDDLFFAEATEIARALGFVITNCAECTPTRSTLRIHQRLHKGICFIRLEHERRVGVVSESRIALARAKHALERIGGELWTSVDALHDTQICEVRLMTSNGRMP